jgi:hypothetical protein
MSTTPPPEYPRFAAPAVAPEQLRAAESELCRIKKEMESSPDAEAYAERNKEYIDRYLTAVFKGDPINIIEDDEEDEWVEYEEVRQRPRKWMCKQFEKRVASVKRGIARALS